MNLSWPKKFIVQTVIWTAGADRPRQPIASKVTNAWLRERGFAQAGLPVSCEALDQVHHAVKAVRMKLLLALQDIRQGTLLAGVALVGLVSCGNLC